MAYPELWFKVIVQPTLDWLSDVPRELQAILNDGEAVTAMIVAAASLLVVGAVGFAVARVTGLVDSSEASLRSASVSVGLGLVAVACTWASFGSSGRSAFVPVTIAFAVAMLLALRERRRVRLSSVLAIRRGSGEVARAWARWIVLGVASVVILGLIYGTTLARSPRGGIQPMESADEAFYSVLGADLATSGTETPFNPGGLELSTELPVQSWYHWGEVWLAAAVITTTDIGPIFARHYVVLPLLLLAACGLSGVVFRRLTGSSSRRWIAGAILGGAVLAPTPLILGPFFMWWARGPMFTITQYGLAVVVGLLLFEVLLGTLGCPPSSGRVGWPNKALIGALAGALIASHVVVAVAAAVGVVGGAAYALWSSRAEPRRWQGGVLQLAPPMTAALLVGGAVVIWGVVTGHALGSAASAGIDPFGGYWLLAVCATAASSGAFAAIPAAAALRRRDLARCLTYLIATVAVLFGALFWGARIADYNTFHAFFGAVVVLATPLAVAATWTVVRRIQVEGRAPVAATVTGLLVLQLGIGGFAVMHRLRAFGSSDAHVVPLTILSAIRDLPTDASLAYSCGQRDEVAPWESSLISINAHTGRSIVGMCFQQDVLTELNGGSASPDGNPLFRFGIQHEIFPDSGASPDPETTASFLRRHQIEYIYADPAHPNRLAPDAVVVTEDGGYSILRVRE